MGLTRLFISFGVSWLNVRFIVVLIFFAKIRLFFEKYKCAGFSI